MNAVFLIRLCLDFTAAGLLLLALAYYWLDNATHEIIGTGIFLLLIGHNLFNRRWWGGIAKGRRDTRTVLTKTMNMSLLISMLTLLVTSVMISQTVFSFLPIASTFTARQLHLFSAYWAIVIVAIHLGWHWTMIMAVVSNRFGITGKTQLGTAALRVAAVAIAVFGLYGGYQVDFSSKLLLQMSLYQWDFASATPQFFAYHAGTVGLLACVAHYASLAVQALRSRARPQVS